VFQRVRKRRVEARDPCDRGAQPIEALFGDGGGNFGGVATRPRRLVSSQGTKLRRSITSASTPSLSAKTAARSQTWTMAPYVTTVTAVPLPVRDRHARACPNGTR
jgi:hypothetical protein